MPLYRTTKLPGSFLCVLPSINNSTFSKHLFIKYLQKLLTPGQLKDEKPWYWHHNSGNANPPEAQQMELLWIFSSDDLPDQDHKCTRSRWSDTGTCLQDEPRSGRLPVTMQVAIRPAGNICCINTKCCLGNISWTKILAIHLAVCNKLNPLNPMLIFHGVGN